MTKHGRHKKVNFCKQYHHRSITNTLKIRGHDRMPTCRHVGEQQKLKGDYS